MMYNKYDIVINLLHTTEEVKHFVYIAFAMFSKHDLVLIKEVNASLFQERDYYLYKVCYVY